MSTDTAKWYSTVREKTRRQVPVTSGVGLPRTLGGSDGRCLLRGQVREAAQVATRRCMDPGDAGDVSPHDAGPFRATVSGVEGFL